MKTRLTFGVAAATALALAAAAGAAHAQQERVWASRYDPLKNPILTYGTPNTADVRLTLTCTPKSGQVKLRFPVSARPTIQRRGTIFVDTVGRAPPWPVSVSVEAGVQRTTVPGQIDIDQTAGGSMVFVELATRAPVIQEFDAPTPIGLQALGENAEVPAPPRKLIGKFLRECR